MNASDGLNCPKKIVNELTDKYNIKLNFIEAKPFPDSKIMLPKDMIFCESVLVKSFDNFEDRLALMLYISKKSHELLENSSPKESKKIQYLKKPVNLAMKEINNACDIDASSKLCILKDTFVELQRKLA